MEWPFGKEKYSKPEFSDEGIQFSTPLEKNLRRKEVFLMVVTPDPEITSASIAITKLEAGGYKISDSPKQMLSKLNWEEELKNSYEIISISVDELFNDTKFHKYSEIITKASEKGLDLVPTILVPEICLSYKKDEQKIIATETVDSEHIIELLFTCGLSLFDQNRWVGQFGRPEYNPEAEFFFVKRII